MKQTKRIIKMKHCHFSILYNELPFLKQKLPFLYEHFDQLIFFDLHIFTLSFSKDGSHEFIKNYPDPDNKITLIEKKDLSDIRVFYGDGSVQKQQMFAEGSKYVKDDMGVFWCTDLDEFFHKDLMNKVEDVLKNDTTINTIDVAHRIFLKDDKHYFKSDKEDTWLFPRICRHKKGNVYPHCTISYPKVHKLSSEYKIFHYAYIGIFRNMIKLGNYSKNNPYLRNIYTKWINDYKKCNDTASIIKLGHPNPSLNWTILKYTDKHPEYIDMEIMLKELEGK